MAKLSLTHKRETFARLYVEQGDASKAYREAFPASQKWKDAAVWSKASALAKDGKVLVRIEELKKKRSEKLDISDNRVIAEIAAIAFSDVGQLEDENGRFKGLQKLNAATRRAIKSVKYKRYLEGKGEEAQLVEITSIEMHPKLPALEKICEIKGITAPPVQQRPVEVTVNITGGTLMFALSLDDDIDITDTQTIVEPLKVELPYKYTARPYQKKLFDAMFALKMRRFAVVWHRRAGKDKTYWQIAVAAAMQKPGSYWYMLPKQTQARKAIWKGRGKDGLTFLDHIPKVIIKSINNTEMYIEFTNGSLLYVLGSDTYNNLVGNNPLGVVYSEWSLCDPASWDYLRPILAENGGWAMFCYTPRGRNHGYSLLQTARKFPDRWYSSVLTVDDTEDNDGKPIITPEIIQQERDEGMSEDMIEQEYYCSFDAAVPGCYFGKEMKAAYDDNRICRVPIEQSLPVYTFWDLGIGDDMAIWLMQPIGKELRMIAFYNNSGEGMTHYIKWLIEFKQKHRIMYALHYAPHDIEVRELMSGVSRSQTAHDMGIDFETVPRVACKADSIEAVRKFFPRFIFDSERCEYGISALASYHREYDEKKKVFMSHPCHDWASNPADAMQTFAMAWEDKAPAKPSKPAANEGGWMSS